MSGSIVQGLDTSKFPGTFGNAAVITTNLSSEVAALIGKSALEAGEVLVTSLTLAAVVAGLSSLPTKGNDKTTAPMALSAGYTATSATWSIYDDFIVGSIINLVAETSTGTVIALGPANINLEQTYGIFDLLGTSLAFVGVSGLSKIRIVDGANFNFVVKRTT